MTDASVSVSFSASIADFVAGVGQAKEALRSFSAPFGEINGQLAALASASSNAFRPERLLPYHDALTAMRSLAQSVADDRARVAAAERSGDTAASADAIKAAELATGEELHLLADAMKQKLALYAEEARFHEIAESEKLTLSRRALDEENALELAALRRQETLGGQSLAARQRLDDMIIEATRRRDDELASLARTALAEQERDYQSLTNSIERAFNSQLRGLVSGTESWHVAFKSALSDLAVRFVEWTETTVARTLIAEAMKTTATTAGVASRTAAENAGAMASTSVQGPAIIGSILSSAAETFAGVFGFLAPLMGPLAAGPAAAAQATVAGMAGSVASADIGMWQVPRDMLSVVHHGELVMPPAEAGAFRDLLSGAANGRSGVGAGSVSIHPTTNFHVAAIDGASVSQWMRQNASGMMKAMDEAVRHGAALGLRRFR